MLDIEERKAIIPFPGSDPQPLVKSTLFVAEQRLEDHPGEDTIWE